MNESRRFGAFYVVALLIVSLVVVLRFAVPDAGAVLPALFEFLQSRGVYANAVQIVRFAVLDEPWAWLIVVFASAPTVAALAVVAMTRGGAGVRHLLGRLRPWDANRVERSTALRAYLLLGVLYVAGAALFLGVAATRGQLGSVLAGMGGTALTAAFWLVVGPFVDEGGTLEELGWRGFALPILLDRAVSPLAATLALGGLWWAWHLPREVPGLLARTQPLEQWAYYQSLFLALCLGLSVIITWFWYRTGGSVLPAILVHGGTNVWSKALAGPMWEATGVDVRSWIVFAGAIVLVLVAGPGLGRIARQGAGGPRLSARPATRRDGG